MPRHFSLEEPGSWTDEVPSASEMQTGTAHPVVLAGSAFVLGLAAGFVIRGGAKEMFDRVRRVLWHRGYKHTVTYDDNLPESMSRREPAPHEGQPRYGGTGAIGVSPASVVAPQPQESTEHRS